MPSNFRELRVWSAAMDLATTIYEVTSSFPQREVFGITAQIRKSAVSIPSNIAEGCGRGSDAQLAHFLDIAQGSAFELETQIILCQRLHFTNDEQYQKITSDLTVVQKMINSLKKSIS